MYSVPPDELQLGVKEYLTPIDVWSSVGFIFVSSSLWILYLKGNLKLI
jgi:hypothetical protein